LKFRSGSTPRGDSCVQIAGAIHRKRTPELVFEVLPAVPGDEGEPT
jgi:hypothetical protein